MRFIFYIMVFGSLCGPVLAENISLKDGDSFILNGEEIRLWGIDAPEYKQTCFNEDYLPYFCGKEAQKMLSELIGKNAILCTKKYTDKDGRSISQCSIGGHDLGAMMVRSGHAIDYKYFSDGYYNREQQHAQEQKTGLWRGKFTPPRIWRKNH